MLLLYTQYIFYLKACVFLGPSQVRSRHFLCDHFELEAKSGRTTLALLLQHLFFFFFLVLSEVHTSASVHQKLDGHYMWELSAKLYRGWWAASYGRLRGATPFRLFFPQKNHHHCFRISSRYLLEEVKRRSENCCHAYSLQEMQWNWGLLGTIVGILLLCYILCQQGLWGPD